jgi:hypothetical protein
VVIDRFRQPGSIRGRIGSMLDRLRRGVKRERAGPGAIDLPLNDA